MNLQNIPRNDLVIKRAFLPKLDSLVFADYSGIEYRLLAYYVSGLGDDSIADDFRNGLDPHAETAKIILGKDVVDDEERQRGKTFNFSVIYGGGTPTIKRQLGCTDKEARNLLRNFHRERPGVGALQAEVSDTLDHRGYIRTPWRRPLHAENNHKAVNALIQGTAADLLRDAMRKTHRWLKDEGMKSHLILSVHDELGLDCNGDEEDIILAALPRLMDNDEIGEFVPIEIEIKRSTTSWADARVL